MQITLGPKHITKTYNSFLFIPTTTIVKKTKFVINDHGNIYSK